MKRMNRTIRNLLILNICDVTNNLNINIKLALMAYRSVFQALTGNTSYFLLKRQKCVYLMT